MGYCCSRCGGLGGLFESSHLHSDPDSCFGELAEGKKRLLLQIDELTSQKAAHVTIIENAYKGVQNFKKIQAELEESNRLNDTLKKTLKALADRVVERFGEEIKYEPVATGRFLDEAYLVLRADEKRICVHKTVPTFDGLGVRYKCQLCNEYVSE